MKEDKEILVTDANINFIINSSKYEKLKTAVFIEFVELIGLIKNNKKTQPLKVCCLHTFLILINMFFYFTNCIFQNREV